MEQKQLVYKISKWDKFQWEEYLENNPKASDIVSSGKEKIFSFPTFASEVFHRLYSPNPQKIEQPLPEASWAIKAHEAISNSNYFEELEARIEIEARGNSFKKKALAGEGTIKFSEKVIKFLPSTKATNPEILRKEARAIAKKINTLTKQDKLSSAEEQLLKDLTSELASINQKGKTEVAKFQKYTEKIKHQLPEIIERASKSAEQAVTNLGEILDNFGCDCSSGMANNSGSLEEKIKLAKDFAKIPKLVRIAKIAGKMKLLAAKKQRTKTKEVHQYPCSVETGNNLNRVLASELVNLTIPKLKPLFFKAYSESALLQYKFRGKEPTGYGPLVICLDSSGSMEGYLEEWSKGVAIALLHIASSQKRNCRILHFNTEIERTDDFPKGKIDPTKLKNSMLSFYGGGTSWEAPFDNAMTLIESEFSYSQADIILITDGECNVYPDWLSNFKNRKNRLKVNTYGVLLGCNNSKNLESLVDKLVVIQDLAKEEENIEAVFNI